MTQPPPRDPESEQPLDPRLRPALLTRAFTVGIAFIFAGGFGALVILGSGIASVVRNTDDPLGFGVYVAGYGVVVIVACAIVFALAAMRAARGFLRPRIPRSRTRSRLPCDSESADARPAPSPDPRVRFTAVVGITATTFACALVINALAAVLIDPRGVSWLGYAFFVFLLNGPALIILVSAAITGWAYLGSLRWQYLNAGSKQFADPSDD